MGVARSGTPGFDTSPHLPTPHPTLPHKGEGKLSWLALEPLTGRTHQLRVHCAEMGWPILGDAIYGGAPRSGGPPLHLHAREIVVPLYKNRAPIAVTAPVPLQMRAGLEPGWMARESRSHPRQTAEPAAQSKAVEPGTDSPEKRSGECRDYGFRARASRARE